MKLFKVVLGSLAIALPVLITAQPKQRAKPKTKTTIAQNRPVDRKQVVADTSNQPFQLLVNARGFKDSTFAVIVDQNNQQYQGLMGYVKNEQVSLRGSIPLANVYGLILTDNKIQQNNKGYSVYLDNEHSQIELDQKTNDIKVISGGLMQDFNELIKTFSSQFSEIGRIGQLKQQYGASGQPADSLDNRLAFITSQINQQIPVFVTKNSESPVSSYLLYVTQSLMSPDQMLRNLALLKGKAATDMRTTQLKEKVETEQLFAEGRPAPDFLQTDTMGKPVSLSTFKGKYVLIDFWASWCGPCRMENPNVVNAFNQYKDKNFTVLGVSLDQDRNKWMRAIHDDGLTWTHVSDLKYWQNAVAQQYRIQSIPQNLLIGPDGKIIAKNLRGGVLHAYLKDLLK